MILALRTDTANAEITLIDTKGNESPFEWTADRRLARELLGKIEERMSQSGYRWNDITGIIVYKGPGSYTGLRIGATVANSIAYARQISIVGTNGTDWKRVGKDYLSSGVTHSIVLPEYGNSPHITQPRK